MFSGVSPRRGGGVGFTRQAHNLKIASSSLAPATMEEIIEVNGRKFIVLRKFYESRIPNPEFLKNVPHLRRDDGLILVTEEIKEAVFEDIVEKGQFIDKLV
jgi:hypothetical protein